ncbi:MAG: PD-(D/E)XK nuclease family protein [Betaproteobacteria bacterium]
MQLVISASARARLDAARAFLADQTPSADILIVGATRGAADDLARETARARATFGIERFSLTELAARAAAARLAGARRAAGSPAGAEAVAARATFDASAAGELSYFAPVARTPGFPRALARTVHELRLAGIGVSALARDGAAGDLARLLARIDAALAAASVEDRAALFAAAAAAWDEGRVRWRGAPVVLLDVPLDSDAERRFATVVCRHASRALATAPEGDEGASAALRALGASPVVAPDVAPPGSDLAHLRRFVFASAPPPVRERAGDVRLFSAPGEGRETIEIARRALDEAARGVPFDEMAVVLRAPQQYLGLLEHAFGRAGVPVYFDRGTRRPDPAGRAFIALLSCACEGLSAKRFDEYLSLGQVPQLARSRTADHVDDHDTEPPDDERQVAVEPPDSDDDAIVAGTLRAPWKWEELIVESSVVAGTDREDGKRRWRRRLDGLAAEFRLRLDELRSEEPESPRVGRYERDLRNLDHLRGFALPIVDALAEWPAEASWGDWLGRFEALAPRVLRDPARVLATLAELQPMADVGPVPLEEARDVLHERLLTLDWDPPARRYGRVFVGSPHQIRGRAFRVVFVPGLAERLFPQRLREDPLLLDGLRRELDGRQGPAGSGAPAAGPGRPAALVTRDERAAAERLLLKIAIGAAGERLHLSYPRLDVSESRPRVPSFYALDVMRAMTGRIPDHRTLAADAAEASGASLAWPAPREPERAIDDLEHDLAVLKPLVDSRDAAVVRGRAHYLLDLNPALRRSVISRWARGRARWSTSDGLIRVSPGTSAALAGQRLGSRPYSLSALQRFAACPYQLLLATIYRLEPWEEPEPLVRLDPLTRGSLFHRVQAEFFRALKAEARLPVTREALAEAARTLHLVIDRVAAEYADELAPAIERVWRDEIDEMRRDLGIWVQRLADDAEWIPEYFEFGFGLRDEGRDARSLDDAVRLDGRFLLRGSVDLIERHRELPLLRVTDHKTGRNRTARDLVIGGGSVLQPVLYSAVVEQALERRVLSGRLFFCTTVGGFTVHPIDINDYTRGQGLEALAIIDRAVEHGTLPAAPAKDACRWCDFRAVCGPREEERIARKPDGLLQDLEALRGMR